MKLASDRLHLYMMDLDILEDARPLLVLLELVHDLITLPEDHTPEQLEQAMAGSLREHTIDKYTASVISKINTYRFAEQRTT